MTDDHEENMEELLRAFSSADDVRQAMREKRASEATAKPSTGEIIKYHPRPQRELDLHGKTASEAEREVRHFIRNAHAGRLRTVRIISGKGLHSPNLKSVLPQIAEQAIAELKREGIVLGFKKEKTGGSFVVYLG